MKTTPISPTQSKPKAPALAMNACKKIMMRLRNYAMCVRCIIRITQLYLNRLASEDWLWLDLKQAFLI